MATCRAVAPSYVTGSWRSCVSTPLFWAGDFDYGPICNAPVSQHTHLLSTTHAFLIGYTSSSVSWTEMRDFTAYCQVHHTELSSMLIVHTAYHWNLSCIRLSFCLSVCLRVSILHSPAVRAEGPSLGLPDRPAAADQPLVRPAGHPGRSLDGEARL